MSGHGAQDRFAVTMVGRRRWSRAEKLAMVAEVGEGPLSPVARKHNIAASLLFRWRREFGAELEQAAAGTKPVEPGFVRVALPAPARLESSSVPRTGSASAIEIVLTCGRRVIVGKDFDALALKRMIEALEPR